jgi:dihydroxyacetone kinase DhaKLM complex PTS-EIIA-like component DhaM
VLTTRSYLDDPDALPDVVRMVDTAFVEGAVAAAVAASAGLPIEAVVAAAEEARDVRKL